MEEHPQTHAWGIPFVMGILLIVGGLFALYASVLTSLVTVVFLGVLLLIVGAIEIVGAFRARHSGHFHNYFLAGLLSIIVGALFLYRPLASLAAVTILIVGYLFVSGLFHLVTAIADRYPRWGWDLAYGVVAIVLGFVLIEQWPYSALWVPGTIVAAEIIMRGIALTATSTQLRRIEHGGIPGRYVAV